MSLELEQALKEIASERARQDAMWGGAGHDDNHGCDDWFDYIEHQIYQIREEWDGEDTDKVRRAYIKIAALACAALESYDRRLAAGQEPTENRFHSQHPTLTNVEAKS